MGNLYIPLLRTIFIGSCVLFLIINLFDPEKIKFSSNVSPRILSWIKSGVIAGILSIMIFVEAFPCSLPVIDTLNYVESDIRPYINYEAIVTEDEEKSEQTDESAEKIQVLSIINEDNTSLDTGDMEEVEGKAAKYYSADLHAGAVIEQPFTVSGERRVSEIYFQCYNTFPFRWSRVRMNISIVDSNTQKVLAETVVGAALVTTGDIFIADIKNINMSKGDYLIRITNIESPQDSQATGAPIYMMCNPDDKTAKPAFINGQRVESPVCVCVN